MATLLILPPHLLETIQDLLSRDVDLPSTLRAELDRTVNQRQPVEVEGNRNEDSVSASVAVVRNEKYESEATISSEEASEVEKSGDMLLASPIIPLTIPHETIEELSRWAGTDKGAKQIRKRGLDPNRYNAIALLAGTEIYIPPYELERLKLAENPDKPNPYLPNYLSPTSPSSKSNSFGSEFRALSKQISTVLNILFSIFGSSIAVYVVSKSSAGYSVELSLLLAILTGIIVGVADFVLVYLFSKRVKESREERYKFGLKMLRGSGRLNNQDEGPWQVEGEVKEIDDGGKEGEDSVIDLKEITGIESSSIKKDIRLRRRGLNDQ